MANINPFNKDPEKQDFNDFSSELDEKRELLKREDIRTMKKDVAKLREEEAQRERERIAYLKPDEKEQDREEMQKMIKIREQGKKQREADGEKRQKESEQQKKAEREQKKLEEEKKKKDEEAKRNAEIEKARKEKEEYIRREREKLEIEEQKKVREEQEKKILEEERRKNEIEQKQREEIEERRKEEEKKRKVEQVKQEQKDKQQREQEQKRLEEERRKAEIEKAKKEKEEYIKIEKERLGAEELKRKQEEEEKRRREIEEKERLEKEKVKQLILDREKQKEEKIKRDLEEGKLRKKEQEKERLETEEKRELEKERLEKIRLVGERIATEEIKLKTEEEKLKLEEQSLLKEESRKEQALKNKEELQTELFLLKNRFNIIVEESRALTLQRKDLFFKKIQAKAVFISTLDKEKNIEEKYKEIEGKEKITQEPLERRGLERQRWEVEEERRKIETNRWLQEKEKDVMENQLKEIDLRLQQNTAKEQQLGVKIEEVTSYLKSSGEQPVEVAGKFDTLAQEKENLRKKIDEVKIWKTKITTEVREEKKPEIPKTKEDFRFSLMPKHKKPSSFSKLLIRTFLALITILILTGAGYWLFVVKQINLFPEKPIEEIETPEEIDIAEPEGTFSIKDRIVTWGYYLPDSNRTIDTIIIHSNYNKAGVNPYNIEALLLQYKIADVTPHYIINRDGKVYRLAPDGAVAYHTGNSQMPNGSRVNLVNEFSIGIELTYKETETPNNAQYESLAKLVNILLLNYPIAFKNILGRKDVSLQKTDPWNFSWETFFQYLAQE